MCQFTNDTNVYISMTSTVINLALHFLKVELFSKRPFCDLLIRVKYIVYLKI